jgi:peptide deformylase
MAVRPIRLFPDEVLSTPCRSVRAFDGALHSLVKDLKETLYASPGVGLAAPQIGISLQVSVIDVSRPGSRKVKGTSNGLIVLVNPRIKSAEGTQTPREGCLSVPDLLGNVQRFEHVSVEAIDENGNEKLIESSGFEALALQHEIDHLNGRLFLDRISNLKTDLFRRKVS